MIEKLNNYAYRLDKSATSDEWNTVVEEFKKTSRIRCLVCNKATAKRFKTSLLGQNIITVNNTVPDNIVYINRMTKL